MIAAALIVAIIVVLAGDPQLDERALSSCSRGNLAVALYAISRTRHRVRGDEASKMGVLIRWSCT